MILWAISVVMLRFANPPITSLMIVRSIDSATPTITRWIWRDITAIPLSVQQIFVTAEDARFMSHSGLDLAALRKVVESSASVKAPRGASTITMQLVKNLYLWPGRSYLRKGVELLMSPIAGTIWGKRRTLELYLNVIELGKGVYGVEAGSRHYYNKSVADLSPHEAASLAAILPNPRELSPHSLSTVSRKRVYRIMKEYRNTVVPRP